jgi:hypothetical protein
MKESWWTNGSEAIEFTLSGLIASCSQKFGRRRKFGLHGGSDWLVWAPFLVCLSDIRKIQRAHSARAVVLRPEPSASRTIARRQRPDAGVDRGVLDAGGRRRARAGAGPDNFED